MFDVIFPLFSVFTRISLQFASQLHLGPSALAAGFWPSSKEQRAAKKFALKIEFFVEL